VPTALRRVWWRVSPVLQSVLGIPGVVLLHHLGIGGRAPLWVCVTGLTAGLLVQHPRIQLMLAGGDLARRLSLRIAVHLGLAVTSLIYLLGWGPLFTIVYLVAALMHIRWSGARAWRPALVWTLIGATLGQAGVALGLVFTYVSPGPAQFAGISGTFVTVVLIRQYGLAAEEREQAQQDAATQHRRFRALVQNSSDIITVLDGHGVVTYVSPSVERLLGYSPDALVGTDGMSAMWPDDVAAARRQFRSLIARPGDQERAHLRVRHADGRLRRHDAVMLNLLDDPAVRGIVVNQRDVTEQRLVADQLTYDASHDLLTGLDNRRAFLGTLDRLLDQSRTSGRRLAVLYIDLDGFKQINDTHGHETGDDLLSRVADLLRASVLGGDVVGRLGGDEFAAVLRNIDSVDQAVAVTRRILDALSAPQPIGTRHVRAAASIGIAVSDTDEAGSGVLLHRADLAMYAAKRRGVGGWVLYSPELDAGATDVSRQDLMTAMDRGEFFVHYQPVVDLNSSRMVGVEALVRWQHPERGVVPPSEFITAAEENGAITALGEWVAEQACDRLARWQRMTPPRERLIMGINVSPRQLESPATAARLDQIFAGSGVAAADVLVEVTESALVDSPVARQTLDAIAALGSRIAIDDFGTGYSSLQYLNRLPIHTLKLDRSFVCGLDGTPEGSAIASAVARLAQTLHLSAVAEGIETPAQAAELAALGYHLAQGFLFARPMDPAGVESLLRAGKPLRAPELMAAAGRA
jgi:diguanylate cyclase (GGDEF)-like protein/PAS domain S-box-containing protein